MFHWSLLTTGGIKDLATPIRRVVFLDVWYLWSSFWTSRRLRGELDKCAVSVFVLLFGWGACMDEIARGLCSEYVAEAWRTGFAAGGALIFGIVVVVHLIMRIVDGTWETLDDRKKGEHEDETTHV